ncbi:MAG TPA: hypothetical protein DCG75_16760 [Bacteroidales bacterium]|nr:hypothetical protein [Bacteroidales bacterium]
MKLLIAFSVIAIVISFIADKRKTFSGIKSGMVMFFKLLPVIISVLIVVSIVLFLIPQEMIIKYLGEESGLTGYIFAAITGSVALIPGFIAYPMAGMLVKSGVGYSVIAVFITTLMMVGIFTLPIEIRFFGRKVSLLRNLFFFIAAILIGLFISLFYNL